MKTLWKIKDEYAQKHHAHDWVSFINDQVHWWIDIQMDEVCKIYAEECCKASLEESSEQLINEYPKLESMDAKIKKAITNESNIVLL